MGLCPIAAETVRENIEGKTITTIQVELDSLTLRLEGAGVPIIDVKLPLVVGGTIVLDVKDECTPESSTPTGVDDVIPGQINIFDVIPQETPRNSVMDSVSRTNDGVDGRLELVGVGIECTRLTDNKTWYWVEDYKSITLVHKPECTSAGVWYWYPEHKGRIGYEAVCPCCNVSVSQAIPVSELG